MENLVSDRSRSRRRATSITALALAALLAASGCQSQSTKPQLAYTTAPWTFKSSAGRKLTTEHFDVYSTLKDSELEQAVPAVLEAAYAQCLRIAPPERSDGPRLTCYVFGDRHDWDAFTRHQFPEKYPVYRKIRHGGYTEGPVAVICSTSRGATLATIAHESWHQYVAARFHSPIPAWLNEGLACYTESFDFAGKQPQFKPQHNTFRMNALRKALREDSLIPLETLLDTDAGIVVNLERSNATQTYYAQAWALTAFLRHGPYAPQFAKLTRDLTDGRFAARVGATRIVEGMTDESFGVAAFVTYLGSDLETIDKAYRQFMLDKARY